MDNYFTSLQLLDEFKTKKINIIGTIRKIEKAPLRNLKKLDRGVSHAIQDSENRITFVRWNDNSEVTIATNIENDDIALTETTCMRYSGVEKKRVNFPQPTLVKYYNKGMGGVDLFDQMRALYRTNIRSKKWYFPLFRFMLNATVVNQYKLYNVCHPKVNLLAFTRAIVQSFLTDSTKDPLFLMPKRKTPLKTSTLASSEIRYDGQNHLVGYVSRQRRCPLCQTCTKFVCTKCNVGLHPKDCFQQYHTK